ncbi:MAG: response regulator [Deltaproteobacteria bacterium]|nr:response regulator [Deltaproteobacteria bacterium]
MTRDPIRVLVVEDGEEYTRTLGRFLAGPFVFTRAGSGSEALARWREGFEVVVLDMRFDRVPAEALLGDLDAMAGRFSGDRARARTFLEENQGAFVLAALRADGCRLPAVFSHDFSAQPRRWAHLERLHAPVDFLADNATPGQVSACLERLAGRG